MSLKLKTTSLMYNQMRKTHSTSLESVTALNYVI